MTAFLIVVLVFLGLITLWDLCGLFLSNDEDLVVISACHLIPNILAIIAISLCL